MVLYNLIHKSELDNMVYATFTDFNILRAYLKGIWSVLGNDIDNSYEVTIFGSDFDNHHKTVKATSIINQKEV